MIQNNGQQNQKLDSLPFCQAHKPNRYQFFDLKRDKLKLVCGTCLYCNQDSSEKVDFSQILDLSIGYKQPSEILMKLLNDKFLKNCFSSIYNESDQLLTQQFNQWEQQFRQLQQTIETIIKNQKDQLTFILNNRKQLQDNIAKIVKFDLLKDMIRLLNLQNEEIKDDALQQIENKMAGYIQELTNDDSKLLKSQFQKVLGNYHMKFIKFKFPSLQPIEEQLKNLKQAHSEWQEKISKQYQPFSAIVNQSYISFLTTTIESRTKKQFQSLEQIYSAVKSGLNFNLLISTISGKENLLFIFQSYNRNTIFGGFTPCRWEAGKHSQDNSLSSFLFSYNLQQIYPLKETNKQWTAYYNNYALIFGGTWSTDEDLLIQSNFVEGFSRLGRSYEAQGKNGSVQSEDLFGGWKPNIQNLEIYEFN